MSRKILFIHGRAQGGHDPAALRAEWLAALEQGCSAANIAPPDPNHVAFPYYGDRLDALVAEFENPHQDAQARGLGADPYAAFQKAVAEEIREQADISETEVNEQLTRDVRERGPENWEWVQAILRAIDSKFPGVASALVNRMTRDAWLYLTAPGVRDEIDKLVEADLTASETVVVGHSLGSIVGYSLLTRSTRPRTIAKYVTVGSPLGIQSIKRRLSPIKFPPHTKDWFNAFDERDVVALRALDSTAFHVTPTIRNINSVHNSTPNRHGIVGYLSDPNVAREIMR